MTNLPCAHASITAFLCLLTTLCLAQNSDPLFGERIVGPADDILLIWNNSNDDALYMQRHNYIGLNSCDPNTDQTEQLTTYTEDRPGIDDIVLDAFATDLDEDGFDEVISLTTQTTDSTSIVVLVHHIDKDVIFHDFEIIVTRIEKATLSEALIQSIEADGDLAREILIAYTTTDGEIYFILLDGDQTRTLRITGSSFISTALRESFGVLFDVLSHDFDEDGKDEILLMGVREDYYDGQKEHSLFAELYRPVVQAEDQSEFQFLTGFTDQLFKNDYNVPVVNMRLAGGDFNGDQIEDFVLAYQLNENNNSSSYFLTPGIITGDLRTISLNDPTLDPIHLESDNCCHAIGLTAGDVTLDDVDDLLLSAFNEVLVIEFQKDSAFVVVKAMSTGTGFDNFANRRLSAAIDLDASLAQVEWYPEICVLQMQDVKEEGMAILNVFQPSKCKDEFEILQKSNTDIETPGLKYNTGAPFALVTGHFDDDGIVLGKPAIYYENKIVQPLIVINSPPTHFDIFGAQTYDISECYSGQGCDFSAVYDEGTMQEEQINTSQTQDWEVDGTFKANYEGGGKKVEFHLTAKYGQTFTNVQSKRSSVTVGLNVKAMNDDMIFATVSDYEIWEYPIHERDSFLGYLTVTIPFLTENRWFPSKSISGYNFLPDHELGNILSYPGLPDINDPKIVAEVIKGTTNSFTIGPKTKYEWRLEFSDFEENNVSQQSMFGLEVGLSLERGFEGGMEEDEEDDEPGGESESSAPHAKATIGFEVNGKYSNTNFTSHITSVKNDLLLKVELGNSTGALTGYRIAPFAFWSKSGALVIDYAVEPELTAQGNFESWWLQQYGKKCDPALMLPWKYDPEKGYPIAHELQRTQTKDIVITPRDASPGDTVLLYTRVHNYSLRPTNDSVRVQWYLGDPDNGGELISGIEGQTEIYTNGLMDARSSEWVRMQWKLPDYSGPIYAVLDGGNMLDEIHENNNKGWINMGSGSVVSTDYVSSTFNNLGQNFPNPFSSMTMLPFTLDEGEDILLVLYDLLGRPLQTITEGYYPAGDHLVEFDGSGLERGIYIYSLTVNDNISSGRLIVAD